MSTGHHRGTNLSPVEDQAVDWVQKLVSGEATPAEIDAADRWRAQDPTHAEAFDAAERVWREMGTAGYILHGPNRDFATALDALGQQRRAVNRRTILGAGVAAVAAAAVYGGLNPPLGLWPSLSELTADYRTGTGEQRNVNFAGDVAINLNTQTSLAIRPATAAEDCIELIAGEASFATPTRIARSLVVFAASGKTVTDAGRFDVRYTTIGERSPVTVTCFEGKVRIEHETDVVDLRPGQRVRYEASGLSQIAAVDPIIESEWRRGIVEFRNAPLTEAIEEINRYRPGRIILMSAALGQKQLNGRFRIEQMGRVLLQLEHAFNAKLQRLPGGIVLLS